MNTNSIKKIITYYKGNGQQPEMRGLQSEHERTPAQRERPDCLPDGELQQLLGPLRVQVLNTVHPFKALLQELLGRIFMRGEVGGDSGGHQFSPWQLRK